MNDDKYKILFIMPEGNWNELNQCMFTDLINDSRVEILKSKFKEIHNSFLQLIRRIHYSGKINSIINLPFKEVWKYSLEDVNFENRKKYILIFPDSVYPITVKYIKDLKKKYDVRCVLFLLNSQNETQMKFTKQYEKYLDYIFTFDYSDAKKYGYIECVNLYSKINISENEQTVKDMYYIGFAKDRINIIIKVNELAEKNRVNTFMRVMGVDIDKNRDNTKKVIFNQWVSYSDSLREMMKCNCILEILTSGQSGATLRYYEAVCYNKKLLTNNKNVVNLPFYNPDYIHVFEKPDDIDWEWVKERIPVNYHYDGRFSPTHLIDKIIELEETMEN